jgi:hypothetical protein
MVVKGHPEITPIRVVKELEIWEPVGAKLSSRTGNLNSSKCKVVISDDTPDLGRGIPTEGGKQAPKLSRSGLWATRGPREHR